jgi:hypothetical protein
MIRSLKFENFRGFRELEIPSLKRINLFAGATNVGKTAILEGVYLLFAGSEQAVQLPSIFRSSVQGNGRGIEPDDFVTFWQSLFYEKQLDLTSAISATADVGGPINCRFRWESSNQAIYFFHREGDIANQKPMNRLDPAYTRQFIEASFVLKLNGAKETEHGNPWTRDMIVFSTRAEEPIRDAEFFNQVLLLEGGEDRLLGLLKQIDPRLEKLRYLKAPGTSHALVYAYFAGKGAISINQTGQGFSKLFSLFCRMLLAKGRVLLIDEIENGLYFESLPEIWRGIAALAESQDIQVFATTHSRECLLAAHEVFKEKPDYDFALHRVQRVKGKLEVITHDKGMLEVAEKRGLEVR